MDSKELESVVLQSLTEEQRSALRMKLGALKTDFVKEAGIEGLDSLTAYYIVKARKEADDAIFSRERQGMVFDLLRWYMSFRSDSPAVVKQAESKVTEIMTLCGQDAGRLKTLASLLRKDLLAGKTAMPEEKLPAFLDACAYMGVDPESLK